MTFDLFQAKNNVKKALLLTHKWRNVAKQNYEFVKGKQWTDGDLNAMNKAGRPAITVNRIKPMINLLCGYSAQNETEPDFLPRSEEDDRVSRVAKGITKYVFDKTNYQKVKKQAFKDSIICGIGCYWLTYEFNWAKMDGIITIKNVSPFDVFVDPESNEEDLSDANFCGRYSWETPEKLKQIYQDKEQAINALTHQLDETELETVNAEPLWYSSDLEKIRVVQYWYKEYGTKEIYYIDGQVIDSTSQEFEMLKASGVQPTVIPDVRMRFATFCGDLLLEEGESPYEHGKFPLVIQYCSKNGWLRDNDGLEPAGIVGDLKDVQRELNKNRSQRMHIVNQQSLGVKFWHGNADEDMKRIIRTKSTVPGANIFLSQGLTFEDGLPANQSIGNLELENKASSDFYNISGITPESLSGSVGAMSGKAIDLRQSVTTVQTAEIFDNAKEAEREIVLLLWGDVGARGLIPQYFDKEKVLRITGEDGKKEFVQINPNLGKSMIEQPQFNEMGTPKMGEDGEQITKVIYDLSCFDFDIVITTSQASATARRANLYQLLEAKKSGVDIPMDIILDFMDFPEKETVKKRLQEQAEQPSIPEFKVSGTLEQLPAQALSQALQSIGVNIPPEQILQERMALRGKSVPMASQPILPPNINQ